MRLRRCFRKDYNHLPNVQTNAVMSPFDRKQSPLDTSECKHYCINHSKLLVSRDNYTNGIDDFGSQAKRYLRKFNGIPREHLISCSRSVSGLAIGI